MKTTIKEIPIGDLKSAPYNPRTIDDEALAALASSMDHFGLVLPLVWNKRTGHVVGGNQRLAILRQTKRKTLPCSVVDLTLAREKILNLRLNNMAGAWNYKDLAGILKKLKKSDWALTGFKDFEVEPLVLSDFSPAAVDDSRFSDKDGDRKVAFGEEQWATLIEILDAFRDNQNSTASNADVIVYLVQNTKQPV